MRTKWQKGRFRGTQGTPLDPPLLSIIYTSITPRTIAYIYIYTIQVHSCSKYNASSYYFQSLCHCVWPKILPPNCSWKICKQLPSEWQHVPPCGTVDSRCAHLPSKSTVTYLTQLWNVMLSTDTVTQGICACRSAGLQKVYIVTR